MGNTHIRRRQWHPTPVLLPGKSHGRRSLEGCSPWDLEELDTTERLHFHFSLLCFGEGNGNPLQCFCLENPRTGEPGGLPSMGLHRVGHDWSDLAAAAAAAEATLPPGHTVLNALLKLAQRYPRRWGRKLQDMTEQLSTHTPGDMCGNSTSFI